MKYKSLRFIIAAIAVMMSALPVKADERVDILIVDPTSGVIHRAPAPIGCWLEGDELYVTFPENLGSVTVEIENQTTGEYAQTMVNSATGSAVFPISDTEKTYYDCVSGFSAAQIELAVRNSTTWIQWESNLINNYPNIANGTDVAASFDYWIAVQ